MAFTLEDGTGVASANAYVSVADADTYWADRDPAATWFEPTTDVAAKQAAIIRATDYLDGAFGWRWLRLNELQRLEWPRTVYYNSDDYRYDLIERYSGVPDVIKEATARLANVALSEDLAATISATDDLTEIKAGSVQLKFGDRLARANRAGGLEFPWLRRLLRDVTTSGPLGGASRKVVRT